MTPTTYRFLQHPPPSDAPRDVSPSPDALWQPQRDRDDRSFQRGTLLIFQMGLGIGEPLPSGESRTKGNQCRELTACSGGQMANRMGPGVDLRRDGQTSTRRDYDESSPVTSSSLSGRYRAANRGGSWSYGNTSRPSQPHEAPARWAPTQIGTGCTNRGAARTPKTFR